jgi:hypothetical protein
VKEHLLGGEHPFHQACFWLGRYGAALFSGWFEGEGGRLLTAEQRQQLIAEAKRLVGGVLLAAEEKNCHQGRCALDGLRAFILHHGRSENGDDEPTLIQSLDALPGDVLLDGLVSVALPAIDEVIPVVAHTVSSMPELDIDWEGLKAGARAVFEAGHNWPVVMVSQDGTIGTGYLVEPMTQWLTPITNPAVEVYFLNERAVASIAAKRTWAALMQLGLSGEEPAADGVD